MIDDELLSKFDRIQDLPISEELLGAYLENSLPNDVKICVGDIIDNSDCLYELIETIQHDLKGDMSVNDGAIILDGILDWIDMPKIETDINGFESYYYSHHMYPDYDELISSNHAEDGFIFDNDDSFHYGYESLDSDDK